MSSNRDLFANFERMRREMDELFGDVFERSGLAPRSGVGFSPRVDVYYCGTPPKAVIKAEVAGVDPEAIELEIRGREVVIAGERRPQDSEGRVYQQIEIEHGPFRRAVQLSAEVEADEAVASYDGGILRVEVPLRSRPLESRVVPIEGSEGGSRG
jgi:HSP20 family protein